MIAAGGTPETFLVDFSKAKRRTRPTLSSQIESIFVRRPTLVTVDGHALGQAICAVMDRCEFADVQGRPWLWNEYAFFLSRPDYDGLRDVEELLRRDLLTLLHEEMVKRTARMPDAFLIRLLVDDNEEVGVGKGVIRVRHRKDAGVQVAVPGEITMRADKVPPPPPPEAERTDRDAGLRVRGPGGAVPVPEGRRVALGRATPEAHPDHIALPGAGSKVNRQQLFVLVQGGVAEFTRAPNANPVEVGGVALAEGESRTVTLPAELVLSAGAWRGTLCR